MALGHKACRDNRSVLYQRIPKLFADLALARGDGRYARIQRAIGGVQLLILDDWGLEPLDAAARHDLLEILEERYGRRSTIITSQIPVDKWHELIGVPPMPTPSSVASSTTRTASISPATACDDHRPPSQPRSEAFILPRMQTSTPASRSLATAPCGSALARGLLRPTLPSLRPGLTAQRPDAKNYPASEAPQPGRHHVGIQGDIMSECPGDFVGIRRWNSNSMIYVTFLKIISSRTSPWSAFCPRPRMRERTDQCIAAKSTTWLNRSILTWWSR
jgi:IstB-like ATP binding protein